ncbi:iron ABC transporter permease [Eubacteriales bacterium OttesenSCG-928-M02]|nr:iron ABC transporter permease [Eubacteriales bacterium OttesenSCG-928-M02]
MQQANNERASSMSGRQLSTKGYLAVLIAMLVILVLVALVALVAGRYDLGVGESLRILFSPILKTAKDWSTTAESVIFNLRVPRIITAILVGAALALSGAAYQSMFKNPMVSPDILGVSSGASVGASIAIVLNMGQFGIQVWAFAFGALAVLMTTTIPKMLKSNNSVIMLVLAGVIVGGLMNSVLGIVKFIAASSSDTALADLTFWQMGSMKKVVMSDILAVAPLMIITMMILLLIRYRLNVLSLGEMEAKSLGVHVGRTQAVVIVCATLLTALSVCLCGTVGWVGMVVPHLGRMLVGVDNRKLLPVTVIMGAAFLVGIDTLARTLTAAELPLGILTGIIGAPFYFFLLYRQRRTMQ